MGREVAVGGSLDYRQAKAEYVRERTEQDIAVAAQHNSQGERSTDTSMGAAAAVSRLADTAVEDSLERVVAVDTSALVEVLKQRYVALLEVGKMSWLHSILI